MPKPPNFFLGLLRVASWLLWRAPMAKSESKGARPPRRPTLGYTVGVIPDELHSIVRLTWFKNGKPIEVEQFEVPECDDATAIFHGSVGQALRLGADVCVLSMYPPEELGVPTDRM